MTSNTVVAMEKVRRHRIEISIKNTVKERLWGVTSTCDNNLMRIRHMSDRISYFSMLCDPLILELMTFREIEDRINSCDIVLGLYKTKGSTYYKRWSACREGLLAIYNSINLEDTVKILKSKDVLSYDTYRALMLRCNIAIGRAKNKKDKKNWEILKSEIISVAANTVHIGNKKVNNLTEHISRAKREIIELTSRMKEIKEEISWAEEMFVEKIEGDGSCDDCYHLSKNNDCNTKECEGGKFIFKFKAIGG